MNFDKIVEVAISEALKSVHKQKVGCVIYNNKGIISKSHNSPLKSRRHLHPKFQRWPNSIHAEMDAIIKSRSSLNGKIMLVLRVNKNGDFRISKPCQHCMKYIEHVKIRFVHYSTNNQINFIDMKNNFEGVTKILNSFRV